MASLSTLELMLHELQSKESLDHYVDYGKMPMLPQRPVSKARIPTNRARKAVLSFHLQELSCKMKNEFVDSRIKRNGFEFINGDIAFSKDVMKNGEEEKQEKGIIGIQKCFRGYKACSHYHKLKEASITLQSFIRGERARKEFQNSTKRLTRTPINQEFVWKPLRNRETTIIYLQSMVRTWLSRRHLRDIENTTINNKSELHEENKNTDELQENIENLEHVKVSKSYVRNLEQEVLRAEAVLRHKKQENSDLELRIEQIDRKWELHNAKMKSKEKKWQDEFTSIQMNLESARETSLNEVIGFPQNPARRHDDYKEITNLTIRQILELQENDYDFQVDDMMDSRKRHKQELRKLKGRFKAWMKEFKVRLHDVKKTFDRFDDARTERVHKTCFNS
ncbi:hypothetical protein QVD17_35098 [Tagetes erecta]|uniref:Uncharacterized protein n=1 Tax=Tagetes erecta TaxID=13708 RepID=A0AAD8NM16_TARER|nr:hypothetical protein QVD17_35098 [Tagetes erecta]